MAFKPQQPDHKRISFLRNPLYVFLIFWITLFVLYLPAAKAGYIEDFLGWLDQVRNLKFIDYVNRSESGIASLYQFTQIITYLFYKIIGVNAWGWHLLYITLHCFNCLLIFIISRKIFYDSNIKDANVIAFGGALLFCICPHASEVVVWEPAFHYLQGLLIIFIIMWWTLQFLHNPQNKYIWFSGILFFCSTFSLEIFYLTPWLVLLLGLYYTLVLQYDRKLLKKIVLFFFLPQIAMFILHLVLIRIVYHANVAHIGDIPLVNKLKPFLGKQLKYLFHVLLLGRYFQEPLKSKVYAFLESSRAIAIIYSIILFICILFVIRYKKVSAKGKAIALFFALSIFPLCIITPIWFPQYFLIAYDRYLYTLVPFIFMILSLLVSYISPSFIRVTVFSIYLLINVYFTYKVNELWKTSAAITDTLMRTMPNQPDKIVLLLDLSEYLNGAPMIGAQPEGGFKIMHNLFMPDKINNEVYDVSCFNMITPNDGAHVTVLNDSMVRVTLNQWGTWWWYQHLGATSYENKDYKLNMKDVGHFYELTLKKPADNYLLLFAVGDKWKIVDWNKKNIDQY